MAVRPQSDDPIGFEELWEHREHVRAVCLGIVKDPAVVDDLVQDTYVRALTTSHPPDRRGPVASWLAAVARHRALDVLRAGRGPEDQRIVERTASTVEGPPDHVLRAERRRRVKDALQELDGRDRDLLVGQAVHGRSLAELAAEFQMSEAAVRSALWRARRRFRSAVERGGPLGVTPARRLVDLWHRVRDGCSRAEAAGLPLLTGVGFQLVDVLVAVVSVLLLLGASSAAAPGIVAGTASSAWLLPAGGGPTASLALVRQEASSRVAGTWPSKNASTPTVAAAEGRRFAVETRTGAISGGADVEFQSESTRVEVGTGVEPFAASVTVTFTCDIPVECSVTAALKATADLVTEPPVG